MIKEKFIIYSFIIILSLVILEIIPIAFPSLKKNNFNQTLTRSKTKKEVLLKEELLPPSLNISGWGKDIFYDRSDIYNSWFTLTGITQFENGYKAIINGDIFREYDRVRGFTVMKITKSKVVLKRNEYRVTLNLEQ